MNKANEIFVSLISVIRITARLEISPNATLAKNLPHFNPNLFIENSITIR
jgi:hypothetical protein